MPNPKLSDNYKGKTFGEISKVIEAKYKDRFDPISRRGLMAEMGSLREEQEYQKQKEEIKQQLDQTLAELQQAAQQPEQQMDQMQQPMVPPQQGGGNMQLPDMEQDQGNFQHAASQSYNQQFAYGGNMDYANGGQIQYSGGGNMGNGWTEEGDYRPDPVDMSGFDQQFNANQRKIDLDRINQINKVGNQNIGIKGNQPVNPQNSITREGINPLRYAPLAGNLFNIFAARRAPSMQDELRSRGFRTSIDENLATSATPRQTQFSNVDMSQIERGITDQARGFTGSNVNVSGGQSGQFMANELANQSNIMSAIGQARMQQQQMDRQTEQLNAQEQARIDQFNQAQQGQRAEIQGRNIGLGLQMADLDARNEGAFQSNRAANIAGLVSNLGNIGKEEDMMKMIGNALGYSSFGNFMEGLRPEDKAKMLPSFIQSIAEIYKSRG